jgi:hypothetical protein
MARAPADEGEAAAVWEQAIGDAVQAATGHPLDARFSNPERWSGYYLVRQRAIASAIAAARNRPARSPTAPPTGPAAGRAEHLLTARGGRLAGRPDHFDRHAVTEYKSALPDPAWAEAASVLDGYWRQLRLYAVLIREATGAWPSMARIATASGQVIEAAVIPGQCEAEADAAVEGLVGMNLALDAGKAPGEFAQPGLVSCGLCPYQAVCPAFWTWRQRASWPELREQAARGAIESIDAGQDGDLYAASVAFEGPIGSQGAQPIALRKSVHGDLTACAAGTVVRVVAAQLRPDGRLRADLSTCIFSEADLPGLVSAGAAQ